MPCKLKSLLCPVYPPFRYHCDFHEKEKQFTIIRRGKLAHSFASWSAALFPSISWWLSWWVPRLKKVGWGWPASPGFVYLPAATKNGNTVSNAVKLPKGTIMEEVTLMLEENKNFGKREYYHTSYFSVFFLQ